MVANSRVKDIEGTGDDNAAVGLDANGINTRVGAATRLEIRIHGPIRQKLDDAGTILPIEDAEFPGD